MGLKFTFIFYLPLIKIAMGFFSMFGVMFEATA